MNKRLVPVEGTMERMRIVKKQKLLLEEVIELGDAQKNSEQQ